MADCYALSRVLAEHEASLVRPPQASREGLERAMTEYIHQGTGLPEDLYTPRAGNVVRPPVLPRHLHVVLCTKVEAWMSTGVPASVITVED